MSIEMNGNPGLRRMLLLTLGTRARQIAQHVDELSPAWLGCPPPLAVVDLAAASPLDAALVTVLDGLATPAQAETLRMAGLAIAHPDELTTWLCVDLIEDREPDEISRMGAFADLVRQHAWARLRANVRLHVLLLADPAGRLNLQAWQDEVGAAGIERLCLAGPVDRQRVRFPEPIWLDKAATALTGMMWTAEAANLSPDAAGTANAVGAAAWQGDSDRLRRMVANRLARQALARLARRTGQESQIKPGRSWLSLALDKADLASAIPAPEPAGLWRHRQPSLAVLPQLPERLALDAEKRHAVYRQSVFLLRESWLGDRIAAGEGQLFAEQADLLEPSTGWPRLAAWARAAQARKAEALAALAVLEDDLEAAGHACGAAETMLQRTETELRALATNFPAPGWRGALQALALPWRWPGWAWDYLISLPRAVQRLLDAYARKEAAAWQEANIHLLRQALLGLAQTAGKLASQADSDLAALQCAEERIAGDPAAPPAWPWTDAAVNGLVTALMPARGPQLPMILANLVGAPEDCATVVQRVCDWAETGVAPLAWNAAEELVSALTEDALDRWLGELSEAAQPLWPAAIEPEHDHGAAGLLAWRLPAADHTRLASDLAPLVRWCAAHRISTRACAADVVMFGCTTPVSIDDGLLAGGALTPVPAAA